MDDRKNFWIKFGVISFLTTLLISCLIILKWQRDLIQKQQSSLIEMQILKDGTVRSSSQYVTKKELEDTADKLHLSLSEISKDLKKNNAELVGINSFSSMSPGVKLTNQASTSASPKPEAEESSKSANENYFKNKQTLSLNEKLNDSTLVPLGNVSFSSWRQNPWDVNIIPRQYTVDTVLGQDDNGRHVVYNKFKIITEGKEHVVPIQQSSFKEVFPTSKFRFSPNLYLSLDAGVIVNPLIRFELQPNLLLSLFSHGQTKYKPDFNFLSFGIGYEAMSKDISLILSPINYNIGNHLPLVDNIFIGPSVSVDTTGQFAILLGMRVKM